MRIALNCFIIHWGISLVFTEEELLVITEGSLKKETIHIIGEDKLKLRCETNLKVKFSWKVCSSFNDDVWNPTSSYISCSEMFKNQSRFCIDVKPNTNKQMQVKTNHYYYTDNGEISKLSELVLLDDSKDPHESCIICTAINNNHTVSTFTRYFFHDKCGTPTHQAAAASKYKLCRGKQSGYDLIKDENRCFSSKPENLEVIQNLTEHGLVDISVKWKDPKRPKQGGIYGYSLTVNKISNGQSIDGSICYITRRYGMPFNDQKKLLKNINLDIEEINNETVMTAKLSELIQLDSPSEAEYKISIEVLPLSEPSIIMFKESSLEDLCDNYYEMHKILPSFCYMVTNITVSNCFPNKSIYVSWKIPSHMSFENLTGMTYIALDGDTHEDIHELKVEQKYFTFLNVISKRDYKIYLKFKNGDDSYSQILTLDCSVTDLEKSKPGLKEAGRIVIGVGLLFVLCLCLSCGIMFKREFCPLIKKLRAIEDHKICMTVTNEPLIIPNNKKVMIVYPPGCVIVEKLVLGLAHIMKSKGINVLVDILQTQRMAEEGLANVLKSDFEIADYVVILCTEPENTTFEYHSGYKFMLDMLINQYVVGNFKQSVAVYFNNSRDFVPCYLDHKSYSLPSSFDAFLQNLYGIQTHFGIFQKIWQEGPEMVKLKKKFCLLCTKLKDPEHKGCNASLCRKANLNKNELSLSSVRIDNPDDSFSSSDDESEGYWR